MPGLWTGLALRCEAGCGIVRDEELKQKLRKLWMELLVKHGSQPEDLEHKADGQPFHLGS